MTITFELPKDYQLEGGEAPTFSKADGTVILKPRCHRSRIGLVAHIVVEDPAVGGRTAYAISVRPNGRLRVEEMHRNWPDTPQPPQLAEALAAKAAAES